LHSTIAWPKPIQIALRSTCCCYCCTSFLHCSYSQQQQQQQQTIDTHNTIKVPRLVGGVRHDPEATSNFPSSTTTDPRLQNHKNIGIQVELVTTLLLQQNWYWET